MKPIALTLTMACLLGAANHALADNHALIMTIDYAGTLPGIEQDAQAASRIAKSMGIPEVNIRKFRNQQLTLSGMSGAIHQLTNTIQNGDKVFLYYSGHGGQRMGTGGKCTESLVTNDFQYFDDATRKDSLEALAAKASSVTTQHSGYLYLLHVAGDGKFYVLFPNRLDANNRIESGTHRFPRERWAIPAQGTNAGTSYLMAYLSETPKSFDKVLDTKDIFAEGEADFGTTRKLGVVALTGRFGASKVEAVREVK